MRAALQAKALALRDERDWKQFHNPKDLAISICLEADVPPGRLANAIE